MRCAPRSVSASPALRSRSQQSCGVAMRPICPRQKRRVKGLSIIIIPRDLHLRLPGVHNLLDSAAQGVVRKRDAGRAGGCRGRRSGCRRLGITQAVGGVQVFVGARNVQAVHERFTTFNDDFLVRLSQVSEICPSESEAPHRYRLPTTLRIQHLSPNNKLESFDSLNTSRRDFHHRKLDQFNRPIGVPTFARRKLPQDLGNVKEPSQNRRDRALPWSAERGTLERHLNVTALCNSLGHLGLAGRPILS